jgi:hypothetical protein
MTELRRGVLTHAVGIAERLHSPTELVEVHHDRDARRGAARRGLRRRGGNDASRHDHEDRGGETYDVS